MIALRDHASIKKRYRLRSLCPARSSIIPPDPRRGHPDAVLFRAAVSVYQAVALARSAVWRGRFNDPALRQAQDSGAMVRASIHAGRAQPGAPVPRTAAPEDSKFSGACAAASGRAAAGLVPFAWLRRCAVA